MSLSDRASRLKTNTIDRYQYLVDDGFAKYETALQETQSRPDQYWEMLVGKVDQVQNVR